MMKKRIIALALSLLLISSLSACKKDEPEPENTTLNPTISPATTQVGATEETTTTAPGGFVLTTGQGETVPTIVTTAFDINNPGSVGTMNTTVPGDGLTIPNVTVPVIVTDFVPTQPTASPINTTTQAAPGEGSVVSKGETEPVQTETQINEEESNNESTKKDNKDDEGVITTSPTTRAETATNKNLVVNGTANDDKYNITVMFDYDGWDRIKSQKAVVKVRIYGANGTYETTKEGHVIGADNNKEGQFEFKVCLEEVKTPPSDGDFVELEFSSGDIESIGGGMKNAPITVSHVYVAP